MLMPPCHYVSLHTCLPLRHAIRYAAAMLRAASAPLCRAITEMSPPLRYAIAARYYAIVIYAAADFDMSATLRLLMCRR